jgi:hypothetical protein
MIQRILEALPKVDGMGYAGSFLFLAMIVFTFGAKQQTRLLICVLIFAAIVFSVLGR